MSQEEQVIGVTQCTGIKEIPKAAYTNFAQVNLSIMVNRIGESTPPSRTPSDTEKVSE